MIVHEMIATMARDLNIKRFCNESEVQYINRILYSAMSCWVKAAAVDQSITDKTTQGVSRKHIFEKCSHILNEMLLRFPQSVAWFEIKDEDDPIDIIRRRLLQNGDLVNVGYDTNIGLAIKQEIELGYGVRQLIGSFKETGFIYTGIALAAPSIKDDLKSPIVSTVEWFREYVKNAWWKAGNCIDDRTEYFEAEMDSVSNYTCWTSRRGRRFNSVILIRHPLHHGAYEYFLEKEEHGAISYHKVDTHLQKMGEHRRIMFALRSIAQSPVPVEKCEYDDHVKLLIKTYLPDKERIILETFAWPHRSIVDRGEWDMPNFIWPYVKAHIEGMGVKIEEV